MSDVPEFDREKCNDCRLCVSVCAHGGFFVCGDDTVAMNAEADCDWCQDCELVCPTGAISFPFEVVEER